MADRQPDSEDAPTPSKKKRRSFSLKFQSETIDYAKKKSNNAAAKEFKVDRKQIIEWRKKEDTIKNLQ
jgi:hypothetical protein